MGFWNGFISGFTGCNTGFSQNAPQEIAPPPHSFKTKKIEPWTKKTGVFLFNKEYAIEPQKKSHAKLKEQGLAPHVVTLNNGSKFIMWQRPTVTNDTTTLTQNQNNIIHFNNGWKEVTEPKKWNELNWKQKIAKGFSNFSNFLLSPFATTTKFIFNDPPSHNPSLLRRRLTFIGNVAFNTAAALYCPPLFYTSLGVGMTNAFVSNAYDMA